MFFHEHLRQAQNVYMVKSLLILYILKRRYSGDVRLWIQQKMLLGNKSCGGVYSDNREAHLQHPSVHDVMDRSRKCNVASINSLQSKTLRNKQNSAVGWYHSVSRVC